MYKWTDKEMWFIKHNDHLKSDLIARLLHKDVEEVEYYRDKFGLKSNKEARGLYRKRRGNTNINHCLYKIWSNMKARCYNKNSLGYKNYGGRGIKVCDRWLNSFNNFLEDMSDRPGQDYQIDRIDNDGDYTPENCRWVISKYNNRNKRTNRLLTAFGETKCIAEWIDDDRCKVHSNTLRYRLDYYKKQIDIETLIITPVGELH